MVGWWLIVACLIVGRAWGDVGDDVTVYRQDGVSFQATILQEDAETITFDVVYDTVTLKRSDIARMVPIGPVATPVAPPSRPPTRPLTPTRPPSAQDAVVGLRVGNRAPAFEADDINGRSHSLAAAKGHVVILHFWATWCPVCRKSIPTVISVHKRYASQGLRLLAVSDEEPKVLRRFAEQHDLPYPVISSNELTNRYGIHAVPTTFVIDQQGIIRHYQSGGGDGFVRVLDELL